MELLVLTFVSNPGVHLFLVLFIPSSWINFEKLLVFNVAVVLWLLSRSVELSAHDDSGTIKSNLRSVDVNTSALQLIRVPKWNCAHMLELTSYEIGDLFCYLVNSFLVCFDLAWEHSFCSTCQELIVGLLEPSLAVVNAQHVFEEVSILVFVCIFIEVFRILFFGFCLWIWEYIDCLHIRVEHEIALPELELHLLEVCVEGLTAIFLVDDVSIELKKHVNRCDCKVVLCLVCSILEFDKDAGSESKPINWLTIFFSVLASFDLSEGRNSLCLFIAKGFKEPVVFGESEETPGLSEIIVVNERNQGRLHSECALNDAIEPELIRVWQNEVQNVVADTKINLVRSNWVGECFVDVCLAAVEKKVEVAGREV